MTDPDEVHVFATVMAQPGQAAALRDVLTELVTATRQEPGVLHYMLHEDPNLPGNFYVFEVYRDAAAAESHMTSAHLAAAFVKATPLVLGPPLIVATKLIAGG